ncbi:MAG: RagB/SusD family nutrient uptake outer membrane protein [Bacteroidales bacterium]|nr:RagB/SusD family nutrient uptake outer membrane protein [Bacteroidales bacterium]
MRNTYNIFAKAVAVIAAVLMMNSCLEKMPGDYIPEEEAMVSLDGAEQIVTGIYTAYMGGGLYSGYLTILPDIQADLVMAVEGNSNTYGEIYQWTFRPTNSEITSVYAGLYKVIGRCNFYLDQVEELRAKLQSDDAIKTLDQYTGEVYCARALAYSELIKCFCEAYDPATAENKLGVVLRSSYFKDEPVKRANLKDSYEFVIKDLDKAMELLENEGNGYDSPYFTEAAARAVRARVALYMKDWNTAIEYATGLINETDHFELSSAAYTVTSDGMNEIDYLWHYDSGYENIWRIGYTQTSYGGALGQVFLNFNNDYTYYYPDYVPAQSALNLYTSNDARNGAYFADLSTGYSHQLTWPLLIKYYGNVSMLSLYIYHVNMPKPLRLAEQYLIRAEAYCNLGNYSAGSADLAALRNSRTLSGSVNVSVNESNWLDAISDERVRELYMEGHRLHDLKRWGRGFERTPQASVQSEGSKLKIEADDPRFVWPIPKHEIEAPGSEIEGNASNRL